MAPITFVKYFYDNRSRCYIPMHCQIIFLQQSVFGKGTSKFPFGDGRRSLEIERVSSGEET